MSIFSKRDKNDKSEADKSSSEESKTVSTPSDSASDDDSRQSSEDTSKTETAKETETKSKAKATKMDLAKDVFSRMYGKNDIKRKDIIKAFIEDCGLTKAGAGTYYAKIKGNAGK